MDEPSRRALNQPLVNLGDSYAGTVRELLELDAGTCGHRTLAHVSAFCKTRLSVLSVI